MHNAFRSQVNVPTSHLFASGAGDWVGEEVGSIVILLDGLDVGADVSGGGFP